MNLLGNLKLFSLIGVVVVVILVATAVFTRNTNNSGKAADIPTATPTATVDPNATATPSVSPTPNAKQFQAADQVIDPAKNNYTATLKTSKGDIVLKLNADVAPNTVNSFVFLAQKGFFDGTIFHRVVKDFVIQGGDPTGTGSGGPGYKTKEEPNQVPNKKGTVSMAKSAGATDFGSQFFINLKDNPALDYNNGRGDKFYPFAEVIQGMDVVEAIGSAPVSNSKPIEPVTILSVTVRETPK
jgi:cyclophilin family peptidyl-prolyl cis-trans isomerase